jgi:hypothetical protein
VIRSDFWLLQDLIGTIKMQRPPAPSGRHNAAVRSNAMEFPSSIDNSAELAKPTPGEALLGRLKQSSTFIVL